MLGRELGGTTPTPGSVRPVPPPSFDALLLRGFQENSTSKSPASPYSDSIELNNDTEERAKNTVTMFIDLDSLAGGVLIAN